LYIEFQSETIRIATVAEKLVSAVRSLPDEEKLRLLDMILTDLDKLDPEIDPIWASEARKRWALIRPRWPFDDFIRRLDV
jgi:hypothetical protein